MDDFTSGQLRGNAAEVYESFFVPALFGQFAPLTADALQLKPGDRVLDVACGTGIVAREAARRVLPGGVVFGLDCNETMLSVARRLTPEVEWREGLAEQLPFESGSFDAAACQFGLMFLDDRVKALSEMWRVLRPGGRLAVAVWTGLDTTPGYKTMVALLERLFGPEIAAGLKAPFVLGEPDSMLPLFADAGISGPHLATKNGTARFDSIEDWVHTDIRGWTLADAIDDGQYALLRKEAQSALKPYAGSDGRVAFSAPAHIVSATKS